MRTLRQCLVQTARVCLGLFITWQLLYLLTANGIDLFRRWAPIWWEEEVSLEPIQYVRKAVWRYQELTAQPQHWSLFAPGVWTSAAFPALELRWDDPERPPVLLLSENEPQDLTHFFRIGRFRERRYEWSVSLVLLTPEDDTEDAVVDRWRRRIKSQVRDNWAHTRAFMRWQLAEYMRTHPDVPPPREVRLLTRSYRIPPPDLALDPWTPPEQRPVARWFPDAPSDDKHFPVEAYNPVFRTFEPVPRKAGGE